MNERLIKMNNSSHSVIDPFGNVIAVCWNAAIANEVASVMTAKASQGSYGIRMTQGDECRELMMRIFP